MIRIHGSFHSPDNIFTHFHPQVLRFLTAGGRFGKALGTGQCPVPGNLVALGTPVSAMSKNGLALGTPVQKKV